MYSPLFLQLIDALQTLPGIGPKSAQRMAIQLLEKDSVVGLRLSDSIKEAVLKIGRCEGCRTFSETPLCKVCSSEKRERQQLCVVESPSDMYAIEQTANYRGLYFVLMGHLSPIDGVGPDEIGVPALLERIQAERTQEVILATNPTVEGEATAHYLADRIHQIAANENLDISITKLAHGIPLGGELEYVDSGTIVHAFSGRKQYQ